MSEPRAPLRARPEEPPPLLGPRGAAAAAAAIFSRGASFKGDARSHSARSAASREVEDARWRLFHRLRPMLYGEHHLEEIAWQERVSREALDDLLAAYSEHLVAVVSPLGAADT